MDSSSSFSTSGQSLSSNTSSPFDNMSTGINGTASLTMPSHFRLAETALTKEINVTPFFTSTTESSSPASKPSTEVLTAYYASLRGLNVLAISALEGQIKKDAFMNLDRVFERLRLGYNKHRELIVKDFESNRALVNKTSTSAKEKSPSSSTINTSDPSTMQPDVQSGEPQSANSRKNEFVL